jgi:hypothetical protein
VELALLAARLARASASGFREFNGLLRQPQLFAFDPESERELRGFEACAVIEKSRARPKFDQNATSL